MSNQIIKDPVSGELKCKCFKRCGGCQLSETYAEQIRRKQDKAERMLSRYSKVQPIIPMDSPYHYRNKVQNMYGYDSSKRIISGIFQSSSKKLVSVDDCMLEDSVSAPIVSELKKLMKSFRIYPYLNATLYLVNYAKAGTKAEDEVLCIKVLDMDENGIQKEETQEYTRAEFQSWFSKLNKECLENPDGDKHTTEYKCPNCGSAIKKSQKGYYCSDKYGMSVSKVYGTDIGDEKVEGLLNGESCEIITIKGIRTLIEPSVVKRYVNGKTYINWKTRNV